MDRPSDYGHVAQRLDKRRAEGAERRRQVPLSAHSEWKVSPDRTDPVEVLIGQGKTRDPGTASDQVCAGEAIRRPARTGTESLWTLCGREMDSNFWYRGTKAVDFRSIPGIAGVSAGLLNDTT